MDGAVAGTSTTTQNADGSNTTRDEGTKTPPYTDFTVSQARSLEIAGNPVNYPHSNPLNPVDHDRITQDIYYCSAPWEYLQLSGKENDQKVADAKAWLTKDYTNKDSKAHMSKHGRPIMITNPETNKTVVVRATSVPQDAHGNYDPKADYIQLHPGVIQYLTNTNIEDPKAVKAGAFKNKFSQVICNWADVHGDKYEGPGPQKKYERKVQEGVDNNTGQNTDSTPGTAGMTKIAKARATLVTLSRAQIGSSYSNNTNANSSNYRETPATSTHKGVFDCSGLTQWLYKQIGINIGWDTVSQYGKPGSGDEKTCGQYIPPTEKPEVGDILFWSDPSETKQPGHVSMLTEKIGANGKGKQIQAFNPGLTLAEGEFDWNKVRNNADPAYIQSVEGLKTYSGARRPLSTAHGNFTYSSNAAAFNPDWTNSPNSANTRSLQSLAQSWGSVFNPPTFDVRSMVFKGTARSFIMDHPLLNSIQQIAGTGLRSFMSAPNGDFVAWFPDYYGVYGTDPCLQISEVEIIDCQIYHDDGPLATHIGIIGDTNGLGQQVSTADYLTTNGIVSIQDASTMQLLFGTLDVKGATLAEDVINSTSFLERYGIRPYVEEQNVIRSHTLEYLYALMTFMKKWTDQFVSLVQTTFMPEAYPGMRIQMTISNEQGTDNYQFYITSVNHSGSRSSGFTTQLGLTAPMKNGKIMHYGLKVNGG